MRGESELKCLNIVKDAIFCKEGKPMQKLFTYKTYLDVSDDEFKKDRIWLVNSECHKSYSDWWKMTVKNSKAFYEWLKRILLQVVSLILYLKEDLLNIFK